ncbi:MAG: metal-sulfur cluster assembly factor [Alicyclobacillus herbarius]|uniref:metal-sulfur cluster assembly factor n=1 Tax=Alicyclobacillus herbarius TaxID=122960 RepID=UPI0023530124|nr:metal-sulfur cluster assembly factor [Alicyclobacillus herbarius]MCL6632217.1 metal-sulfur cluster assembly factor [Alicyclobacillus herbarius]
MAVEPYWTALDQVIDPEFPISVVDMGLIYDITEAADGSVTVTMTYTSVGCACMQWIEEDIRNAILAAGAKRVDINVVWDPPWTVQRLTSKGRSMLAQWGVSSR